MVPVPPSSVFFRNRYKISFCEGSRNLNLCSAPQELEKWVKAALQFPGRATSVLTLQVEWCKFYDVDYVEQDGHACVFGKQLLV